jgi:two-component system response regulator HydG
MNHILIVDDEPSMRTTLKILLENEGYETDEASSIAQATELLNGNIYDLIITDLRLDDGDGTQVLEYVKTNGMKSSVIVLTAFGSIKSAVEAMKLGAYEYVTKPIDSEHLLMTVSKAIEHNELIGQIKVLKKEFNKQYNFQNILGKSNEVRKILDMVRRIAETDVTVLIQGKSGTGKELIAKAIHSNSLRSLKPFVAVNCGAIPESLLESELFGHIKGSFTGAVSNRVGMFEEAEGGTLFLDEVGTMSLSVQAKLLRAIQEKTIQRLGNNKIIKVNTRIISASNRDLEDLVKENSFREDLYYRLRVVELHLPPLMDRREDVLLLANTFLDRFRESMKRDIKGFSREVTEFFLNYSWPGNIRELENCIESAVALCQSGVVGLGDLPMSITRPEQDLILNAKKNKMTLDEFEREYILETLKNNGWNQKKSAKILNIGRNTLWRKIKEYNLSVPASNESND